ncbi:MAG: VPLPA-CTERM sorting domain-containing protein [Pseudomonadota bacterium]
MNFNSLAALAAVSLSLAAPAGAATLGVADFDNPTITTFTGIGNGVQPSLVVDGNTYSAPQGVARGVYNITGMSGDMLNNVFEDLGSISIAFGTAVDQAGLFFGTNSPMDARLTFFSGASILHTSIQSSGDSEATFYGWESTGAQITDILIEDLTANSAIVVIDNVYFGDAAPVPLPASLPLLAAGLLGLGYLRRRNRVQ